jgi:pimeloyl-ACP methyl ester carboxylesterase
MTATPGLPAVAALRPFRVNVPDDVLTDLRGRLERTRFPDEIGGIGWAHGLPLGRLREIVRYWLDGYDWRVHEARLNRYQQFITTVDGQPIHFLHVRSRHQAAIPLFLTHGWPGSVAEFLDVIDRLADPDDPADAFHLVVPSLPGYGFSCPVTETGWTPRRIAAAFGQIADRLGYQRYGVQGGDWGALVSYNLADLRPDRTLGLHVNLMNVPPPAGQPSPPTPWRRRVGSDGGGYEAILGTRPQTMGYLLDDSPAGLAAWIIEKFHEWTEGPDERCELSMDLMLTNVMLYWVNRAGASSSRLYWERRQHLETALPRQRVTVPTGVANFPGELTRARRSDAERYFNIVHWTELPRGGHFPAMEVPDLFVADVRTFFRSLR